MALLKGFLTRFSVLIAFAAAVPSAPTIVDSLNHWLHEVLPHSHGEELSALRHVHEHPGHQHAEPTETIPTLIPRDTSLPAPNPPLFHALNAAPKISSPFKRSLSELPAPTITPEFYSFHGSPRAPPHA